MLSSAHRLRKRQDFALVYQHGACWRGRYLLLRTRKQRRRLAPGSSTSLPQIGASGVATRIGITVSQKVSKRAVQRNRIKRQLRAACRVLLPQIRPGWDLVITVRASRDLPTDQPDALGCDYKEFLQELRELLAEAKVLDGH